MNDTDTGFSGLGPVCQHDADPLAGAEPSRLLVDASASIMAKQGVRVDQFRAVDHPIASGAYPDMREHGWEVDAWPELFPRVIAGPIWLGDNSSETKKVIERLYAHSGEYRS